MRFVTPLTKPVSSCGRTSEVSNTMQKRTMFGLGENAPYTLLLIGALVSCALLALLVSVNAIVYRRFAASRAVV